MSQDPQSSPPLSSQELKRQQREAKAIEKANRNWFARHKILTAVGVIVVLIVLAQLVNGGGSQDAAEPADAVASSSVAPSQSSESESGETSAPSETAVASEAPATIEATEVATIGNGDHIVGTDIAAGQYRAEVEDSMIPLCTVSQSADESILDVRNANEGSVIFTVADKPGSVVSFSGCGNIGLAADSIRANPSTITNGDWLVGLELAPGTYRGVVDTDSMIKLGTITQTSTTGDIMDIRNANEGNVIFTVADAPGSVVSFSGFKEIQVG